MIRMENLCKVYMMGDTKVEALQEVNIRIEEGEFVAVIGPSGSGKSTLMNITGCLDVPTSGKYWLGGQEVSRYSDNQLAVIRNRQIGFVFQSFNLMPRLTALDNVLRPLVYRGVGSKERLAKARQALERVGLRDRMDHRPTQLSGGEQQRVAVARAIAGDPPIILADEPTGNLDTASGFEVMKMLHELHTQGKTVVLITHNSKAAMQASRQIAIQDGRVTEDREGGQK
ncbi:MAG TPA: ABC transporter ATP-binding protein [Candidatus Limnocylindrales bacterium]|nr:ABC transporter ATP-binding protein [Candidatus Limnocylindrales bacterium]